MLFCFTGERQPRDTSQQMNELIVELCQRYPGRLDWPETMRELHIGSSSAFSTEWHHLIQRTQLEDGVPLDEELAITLVLAYGREYSRFEANLERWTLEDPSLQGLTILNPLDLLLRLCDRLGCHITLEYELGDEHVIEPQERHLVAVRR